MRSETSASSLLAFVTFLTLAFSAPVLAQENESGAEPAAESSTNAEDFQIAETRGWNPADWELEDSEYTPEPGWVLGKLDNGLRYIIRPNNRPENTALVRMQIGTGSIDEAEDERGYAHFVEHMAFNGSTNIPEGEMIKLLEREGLAFGPDTNASTSFDTTQYKLNLPRNDADLLDTALMLMRETASELTFAEEAVEREKGVVLSERRQRNNYALKNAIDQLEFIYPDSLASQRLPIGKVETIEAANGEKLRAFWEREYVPDDTVLIIVGQYDPALVEARIAYHFADWQSATSPDQPDGGPVDPNYAGQTDIYLDPALNESVSLVRNSAYQDRPDTKAERQKGWLRAIGTGALQRRLQRLVRSEDPPFRGAGIGANDLLEAARTTELTVATEEGGWKRGLDTILDEYRRALIYGFTQAEITEQLSNFQTALENAVANAPTRKNAAFAGQASAIAKGDYVPNSPAEELARFERMVPDITPDAVLAAFREEYGELDNPLIRFSGKTPPEGGADALRATVQDGFARKPEPPADSGMVKFAYTDFGTPGTVIEDSKRDDLGIRTIRFANNVQLNLKPTDLSEDRISVRLSVDGGNMLASKEDPLAVELSPSLPSGGLGQHSLDELQSILAGRSVSASFGAGSRVFTGGGLTTPRDLELQLQLMAAFLTDPGYRPEGLGPWQAGLDDFFARLGKTPGSAYSEGIRPILSDNDPRFSRQPIEAYRALDYNKLRNTISDRLANGAVEIALVGDFDEDEAIAMVARTFGALPEREAAFREYEDRRQRSFTDNRGQHTIWHDGEADQALIRMIWPTDDNNDWEQTSRLQLLASVAEIMLIDKLREELGQAYSASASSSQSETWRDYGTFSIGTASVDAAKVDEARAAMMQVIAQLRAEPVDPDILQRARQPILESLDNRLKSNNGWMRLVDRANSQPDDIERFLSAKARYEATDGEDLQELALRYLDPAQAVEIRVLPRPANEMNDE